jgi:hypothetical protein
MLYRGEVIDGLSISMVDEDPGVVQAMRLSLAVNNLV